MSDSGFNQPHWTTPPAARGWNATPPTPQQLRVESASVRISRTWPTFEVRLSAEAARDFAEALHLGGSWGKRVTLWGPDGSVFINDNYSFRAEVFSDGRDIAILWGLGGIERLAARFRAELTDFRAPLRVRWRVMPDLR